MQQAYEQRNQYFDFIRGISDTLIDRLEEEFYAASI